ncbi:DUF4350 domain-containing protein [Cerasicoccus maritimus]|uniref:DUF4350 domain-containing protein n=1 Tax=Cerasicoccus maritimus TaxID=490089 RepID=UPI00285259D0|nr:DUF4350 domain-containing protein [Cerasicoccus maritimus]
MKQRYGIPILLLVCVAGLIFALVKLVHVRLERGDIYPAHSSLRVDPLGARALAESLDALSAIEVERNYRHWAKVDFPSDGTLYVFRAHPESLFERRNGPNRLLDFMGQGGRVVMSYADNYSSFSKFLEEQEGFDDSDQESDETPVAEQDEKAEPADDAEAEEDVEEEEEVVVSRWELSTKIGDFDTPGASRVADVSAPEKIEWKGQDYFVEFDEEWEVLYETKNGPVALWRSYGKGEVILLANTYLFSNEAMMLDREAGLLSWLHGDAAHAIFDEWHFGLREPTGVAILMRRYRLGGLALGMALLAGLFVWRNLYSLTPVRAADTNLSAGVVRLSGSTHTGLRNLLKRSIAPVDLLPLCVERFSNLGPQLKRMSGWNPAMEEIRAELSALKITPPRKRRPVQAYRNIVHILTKHRINLR